MLCNTRINDLESGNAHFASITAQNHMVNMILLLMARRTEIVV